MAAKKVQYGLGEETPKTTLRWLYLPFILLLGLGSMALATQRIAAFFEYQAALGQPWGIAFGLPWYAPWSAFVWQEGVGANDTYGFIEQAIAHSQVLSASAICHYRLLALLSERIAFQCQFARFGPLGGRARNPHDGLL